MPAAATLLAVGTLLLLPGPTNVLLAAAGLDRGLRAGPALAVAAALGYALSVSALVMLLGPAVAGSAWLGLAIRGAACAWLLACAVRLWSGGAPGASRDGGRVRPVHVFVTTALNPKGLVFAFAMAPMGRDAFAGFLASLCAITLVSSLLWVALGSLAGRPLDPGSLRRANKAGALVLAGFAAALAGSALG